VAQTSSPPTATAPVERTNPDLRDWLRVVEAAGRLRVVEGADWQLEIGAIAEMFCLESASPPCVLFDRIKDYPPGWRVANNLICNVDLAAQALNLPARKTHLELVELWRERSRGLQLTPVRVVPDGPVFENVSRGADIDLGRFPTPLWHEDDGGRFLGTMDIVVTRDPDNGQVNVGTYRMMILDRDKLGLYIAPSQHGRLHRDKYFERGQRLPVVAAFGLHPLLFVPSSMKLPLGVNEYEWVGAVQGAPVEVIEGPVTGLPFPANAEIVVGGYVDPEQMLEEGPFGEFTGYYASAIRQETYVQVEALYHRNDPILTGAQMTRPPGEMYHARRIIADATFWEGLERAGISDIRAVATWPASVNGFVVISLKQRYAGHAKQAGLIAAQTISTQLGRYVVVVDEDIDPSNVDEVLWALWTRSDPEDSVNIVHGCRSQPLDPRLPPEKRASRDYTTSYMVIDATRPFHWRNEFPKVVGTSRELQAQMRAKWGEGFFQ
jgi:4-hydroxy-3-polyprenylbenzoate decarboxylase